MVVAALALYPCLSAGAQESSAGQSLGEVARKARKEHVSANLSASHVVDSDDDGPDAGGVWRIRMCSRVPCSELSVTLPKSLSWTRSAIAPRPVVIPLGGPEDDPNRIIRVYAAPSIEGYAYVDIAKRVFLQGWLAKPEYFGRQAHILLDEHIELGGYHAIVSHFYISNGTVKYRGMSLVASLPNGNSGFACVFRDQDVAAATSICDAIVKSANNQSLAEVKPRDYDDSPATNPQDDDPSDSPRDDDVPQ